MRTESGGVDAVDNKYRALVDNDESNTSRQIRRPRRRDETRAQTDLEVIRAAGAGKATRAGYMEAMSAEAERFSPLRSQR